MLTKINSNGEQIETTKTLLATEELQYHEVANIFPLIEGDVYRALVEDIKQNGLREPIWVSDDKIIDGRNRYKACKEAGIEIKYREWRGDGSLLAFVSSSNLHRRHLSESQRSIIAARMKPMFEEEARNRKIAAQNNEAGKSVKANLPEQVKGQARDQAATAVNVSPRSVESGSKVLAKGSPSLIEAVEKGKIAVSSAAIIADAPKEEQENIVAGDKKEIRVKIKEIKKRQIAGKKVKGAPIEDKIVVAPQAEIVPVFPEKNTHITKSTETSPVDTKESFDAIAGTGIEPLNNILDSDKAMQEQSSSIPVGVEKRYECVKLEATTLNKEEILGKIECATDQSFGFFYLRDGVWLSATDKVIPVFDILRIISEQGDGNEEEVLFFAMDIKEAIGIHREEKVTQHIHQSGTGSMRENTESEIKKEDSRSALLFIEKEEGREVEGHYEYDLMDKEFFEIERDKTGNEWMCNEDGRRVLICREEW